MDLGLNHLNVVDWDLELGARGIEYIWFFFVFFCFFFSFSNSFIKVVKLKKKLVKKIVKTWSYLSNAKNCSITKSTKSSFTKAFFFPIDSIMLAHKKASKPYI